MAYHIYIDNGLLVSQERVAVLYHYQNGGGDSGLELAIDQITNQYLPPDRILIVCCCGRESEIHDEFKCIDEVFCNARLRATGHLIILPYGEDGLIVEKRTKVILGKNWSVSDDLLRSVSIACMDDLIRATGVIMQAPDGYVFRKLSEKSNRLFIRTGNIFRNPEALAVTSFLLMRLIPLGVTTIYIDSFTIFSPVLVFVRDRAAILSALGRESAEPKIENFHSYNISSQQRFLGDRNYAVVISASTSGGLKAKLVRGYGVRAELVYHMVVITADSELKSSSMFSMNPSDMDVGFIKADALENPREISIGGEEFIASSSEPGAVSITMKHFSSQEKEVLSSSFYQKNLSIARRRVLRESRALFELSGRSEGGKVAVKYPRYNNWVSDVVCYQIPLNVGCILAVGVDNCLASQIARKLNDIKKDKVDLVILPERDDQFDLKGKIVGSCENRTVLIVVESIGRGEELLSVSRRLRDINHEHRHYVVGYSFFESMLKLKALKSSLTHGGGGRRYGWSCYLEMPVGRIEAHDSWDCELGYLQGLDCALEGNADDVREIVDAVEKRKRILSGAVIKGDDIFWSDLNFDRLMLRKDSVLFTKKYEYISQVTVYLMISAALQRARDNTPPDPNLVKFENYMCFDRNPFAISVLNPEMFFRYNDGVIQAAFLRSCLPCELNYANCPILSKGMFDIIISMLRSPGTPNSEAIFEFLLALATGRLKLRDQHYCELKSAILSTASRISIFWRLLTNRGQLGF